MLGVDRGFGAVLAAGVCATASEPAPHSPSSAAAKHTRACRETDQRVHQPPAIPHNSVSLISRWEMAPGEAASGLFTSGKLYCFLPIIP